MQFIIAAFKIETNMIISLGGYIFKMRHLFLAEPGAFLCFKFAIFSFTPLMVMWGNASEGFWEALGSTSLAINSVCSGPRLEH